MLPFLLPLLMAAGGAGIGALANKKHRLKGALMGAGLGAAGGVGLGAAGIGGAAAGGLGSTAGAAAGADIAAGLPAATASSVPFGQAGIGSMLSKAKMLSQFMPHGQQQEQQLPPMYQPNAPMPTPISQLNPGQFRPPVQMSYNSPNYGGYYG